FGLTAPNHCMPLYAVKVGFGFVRWNVSVRPRAVMPLILVALPSLNAFAPTITFWNWSLTPTGEPIFGLRLRSHARWYDAAVTVEPSESFRPGRMWNVYVRPFLETVGKDVAASG